MCEDKIDLSLWAEAKAFRQRAEEAENAELRQGFLNIANILEYLAVQIDKKESP